MFTVYATTLLYRRALELRVAAFLDDEEELLQLNQFLPQKPAIPKGIYSYLSGYGLITDGLERPWILRTDMLTDFIHRAGFRGWYGQIDGDNFWMYQTNIAPGVLIHRLSRDLFLSEYSQLDPHWDLPDELMPGIVDEERVNTNLLGWRRAEKLTTDQIAALELANISITLTKPPEDYDPRHRHRTHLTHQN